MIASLTEEAEAIGWYEQRIAVEKDKSARAIMRNAQKEEFKHFGMDLEFLLRQTPQWRAILQDILFKPGDIVEHGEEAEEERRRLPPASYVYPNAVPARVTLVRSPAASYPRTCWPEASARLVSRPAAS